MTLPMLFGWKNIKPLFLAGGFGFRTAEVHGAGGQDETGTQQSVRPVKFKGWLGFLNQINLY